MFSPEAHKRYLKHFGPPNHVQTMSGYTLVFVDAPSLVEEEYERTAKAIQFNQWTPARHIPFITLDGHGADASSPSSGDDHDYCEYIHTLDDSTRIREVTLAIYLSVYLPLIAASLLVLLVLNVLGSSHAPRRSSNASLTRMTSGPRTDMDGSDDLPKPSTVAKRRHQGFALSVQSRWWRGWRLRTSLQSGLDCGTNRRWWLAGFVSDVWDVAVVRWGYSAFWQCTRCGRNRYYISNPITVILSFFIHNHHKPSPTKWRLPPRTARLLRAVPRHPSPSYSTLPLTDEETIEYNPRPGSPTIPKDLTPGNGGAPR
ncbi:hypothetical protein IMY05_C4479000100 [Salix suchowensis]|nr:hypothetical protein IMY05_C4479000100 [Salix suchowensis]